MKKRIISLVLTVMMLISLVPSSVFAIGGTSITRQPADVSVRVGGTAVFTIAASNPDSKDLKYIWFDADEVDLDSVDFSNLRDTIKKIESAKLGEGMTLTLTDVQREMSIRCAVYYQKVLVPRDLALSDTAVLSIINEPCAEHTLTKVEAKAATCAEAGNIEYYYCAVCRNYYLDADGTVMTTAAECSIAKLTTHDAQYVAPEVSTCSDKGHIEYWQCTVCGKLFADAGCTKETTRLEVQRGFDKDPDNHKNLVEYPAQAAGCTEAGSIHYWYCDGCRNYYSDSDGKSEIKKSDTELAALGHDYKWRVFSENGAEYHAQQCERCKALKDTGSHTGGTATCINKAVCTICGFEYGEKDPSNHVDTVKQILVAPTPEKDGLCDIYCNDCKQYVERNAILKYKDTCEHKLIKVEQVPAQCESTGISGTKEHYKCTECGTLFADAGGTDEITDISVLTIAPLDHYIAQIGSGKIPNTELQTKAYDAIGHWSVCKYCDFEYTGTYNSHTFTGLPATCHSGRTCLGCDYDDGTRDMDNHDGKTELRGAVEPTDTEPGYTGDKYCLGCGQMIEKGRVYYKACPDGCENTLEFVAGVPKTCYVDGTKDHYKCTVCGNEYMDKNASVLATDTNLIDKHGHEMHPGLDALGAKNLMELAKAIGANYTDLIKLVTSGDLTLDNFLSLIHIRDIDHCHDDEYHWLGCQLCGKTLEDLKDELEASGITVNSKWYELSRKTEHTGGTATCVKKAVCDECGEEYGQLSNHRYDAVVTPATCTKDGYTTHTCSGCKDSYVDSETRKTGHKIVRGRCSVCSGTFKNPFYDVPSNEYFYSSVMWAYYYTPQITTGAEENYFMPNDSCTREQVVTFLWRAAGAPAPKSTVNPFVDVSSKSYAYKAILWAAENGITNGVGDNRFAPGDTVTRGEFVTFLWRYYGKPVPSNLTNPFSDNIKGTYYYTAVLWAAENGVTNGTGDGLFSPSDPCKRCEVVTFLYRAIAGK